MKIFSFKENPIYKQIFGIDENGKKYIEQFLNQENEIKITNKIIEIYCKTVKIKYD